MRDESTPIQSSAAVVQPEGDLVAAKLPALRSKLREMVEAGIIRLTVDLAATKTVDSAESVSSSPRTIR